MPSQFQSHGFSFDFPYNDDAGIIGDIAPHQDIIEEVYADFHPAIFPSARIWNRSMKAEEHLRQLILLSSALKKMDIALSMTLNTLPLPSLDFERLSESLDRLKSGGELRVVVADFFVAKRLRERNSGLSIGVSTVADVDSQLKAKIWMDEAGIDTVVISRRINKNLRKIEQIKSLGVKVKMVVSDLCMPDCPLAMKHLFLHSVQRGGKEDFEEDVAHFEQCRHLKENLPIWHWAKKEVLPMHLPRYKGLVDLIKLTDRRKPTKENLKGLKSYLAMKEDIHPVFGYREPMESLEKLTRCERDCETCRWCEEKMEIVHPPQFHHNNTFLEDEFPDSFSETEGYGQAGTLQPNQSSERGEKRAKPLDVFGPNSESEQGKRVGMVSLKEVHTMLRENRDERLLRVYAMFLRGFKDYLSEKPKALANGFLFHRAFIPFDGAVAFEWSDGDSSFAFALYPDDAAKPAAFKVRDIGVSLYNPDNDIRAEKAFVQNESVLKANLRNA